MTSIPTSTPWVSPPSGRQARRWNTLAPILLLLALAFLLAPPGASPPAQAAPQGAASLEDWNHSYPRIAMQHFGDANADWYARFDLIISQTSPRLIAATKALNPRTMFIFTDSVFVVDNYNNMPSCPGWSDQFLAVDSSGQVIEQQKGWPITDVSNLAPTNADGERFNQVIPRCFAEMAASGGYDGAGTDWFWDKPRKQDIDLDRNGVNDYQEHGEDWVNRTWREGAAVFMENWRKEINLRMGETTPIWINTGLLHDDAQMPGSLENTNGLEMERVPGFYSFSYAWRQYDRWIREGRKPTVWVTDARPSGSDPYTYRRRGHSKNYLELMRTMLAFTLMGDGYFEFQPIEAGEHKFYAYYDEFDVQLGDPIDRGAPGPADDAHLLANNLMVRFFENGAVILNPNPQPVTVRLEDIQGLEGYSGPYYRFRGGQDLALNGNQALNNGLPFDADHPITLDGHSFDQVEVGDGILLVKEPQTVVSDIIVDHLEAFTSPASAKAELQPTEVWENSPSQGNGWAQRQAAWNKAEPLYAYLQTTAAGAQATFRPNVGIPGAYEIFEWHPDVDGACAAVTAQIIIDGQVVQEMQIDQSRPGGRWYSLGQFDLPAGESSAVKLTTPGGCTATADAILFSYRGNSRGPSSTCRPAIGPTMKSRPSTSRATSPAAA